MTSKEGCRRDKKRKRLFETKEEGDMIVDGNINGAVEKGGRE